jgi:hypothetical protein
MQRYRDDCLLFRWRDAYTSDSGPAPTTRLVLWTISKHMDLRGSNAFPGQETIARESGLSLKAVKNHLKIAEETGWIGRNPRIRQGRQSFRYGTDYIPRFPCSELDAKGGNFGEPEGHNGERDSTLGNDVPTSSSMSSPS